MSPDTDRIPVPTNGRGPHAAPTPLGTPDAAEGAASGTTSSTPSNAELNAELSVAFTPKQIAVGFGILASLILLLVGVARRRAGADLDTPDPSDRG